jgi:hypothetical protein
MNFLEMLNQLVMFFHIYVRIYIFSNDFSLHLIIDLDSSTDLIYDGKTLHVSLIPNPSHLEVNLIFRYYLLLI